MENEIRKRRAYNALKIIALRVFERTGWLSPVRFARIVQFTPKRAAYSYLGRLHRWGLLHRMRDPSGRILYRLSRRGTARLEWLISQTEAEELARAHNALAGRTGS